ncbi:hypothetical protein SLA2020_442690 [Shorea laevis]
MAILEDEDLEFVAFISRRLWLRRNTLVFGGALSHPLQVLQQGCDSLDGFRTSNLYTKVSDLPGVLQTATPWKKPVVGVVKTNWDAAIDTLNNRMGVGVIIRDEAGDVVPSMCVVVPYILDPAVAEAVALWKAVELCNDLQLPRLHLEGDCQKIIQALRMEGPCWSRFGYLVEDSRSQLDLLHDWSVSHTRQEANRGGNF